MTDIAAKVFKFLADTGLSEHRVGILLANNGRLVERLRRNGDIYSNTEKQILAAIDRERAVRFPDESVADPLSASSLEVRRNTRRSVQEQAAE